MRDHLEPAEFETCQVYREVLRASESQTALLVHVQWDFTGKDGESGLDQ